MDKRVIFSVAGAGKTTYIVNSLTKTKKTLIVTYTVGNYDNLCKKICDKFNGMWPENICVMKYFSFLYHFCYKPFFSDKLKLKGICFENNSSNRLSQDNIKYYITKSRYVYSNRLSLLIEKQGAMNELKLRLEKYFDEFIVDEIQDISGRDFNFLEQLMSTNINMLFVGDFFQHTYDTSRDGRTNTNLFKSFRDYEKCFINHNFISDNSTLVKSWRCSPSVCQFITNNLGIEIHSNKDLEGDSDVVFISDDFQKERILSDPNIVKLHYQKAQIYGIGHKNWGETKGEDHYKDVCVLLNKNTATKYAVGRLNELSPITRNKLYVAITRAHGKVYLVNE